MASDPIRPPIAEVKWTEQAELDLEKLTSRQRSQALDKEKLILAHPEIGDHKVLELWCLRSFKIDNLRMVYALRPWEGKAYIITIDEHDTAYARSESWGRGWYGWDA